MDHQELKVHRVHINDDPGLKFGQNCSLCLYRVFHNMCNHKEL